ncbi:MAG: XisH family protein [Acidobacteriota bacterium]|nr:XisH family protein [Acidobacteriota bacterium]
MPAKDFYHDSLKQALIKDGWDVTADPLTFKWGKKDIYIDLGAEEIIAAEKRGRRIAVEIKSFISDSEVEDLKNALGQFILYHDIMLRLEPDRTLYLAVRESTYADIFEEPIGEILLENRRIKLIVFDPQKEVILKWID